MKGYEYARVSVLNIPQYDYDVRWLNLSEFTIIDRVLNTLHSAMSLYKLTSTY